MSIVKKPENETKKLENENKKPEGENKKNGNTMKKEGSMIKKAGSITNPENVRFMECPRFKDFMQEFILSDDSLELVYERFQAEIKLGLGKETNKNADTKCFLTYVQNLPTGEEKGKYVAIDFGGSKFRILLITLKGNHQSEQFDEVFDIPQTIMRGTAVQLFDYIVQDLFKFLQKYKLQKENLPLGFTFSFPVKQTGLSKAILIRWTKGFNCTGAVNNDVGRLFQEALARRGDLQVKLMAILNDTTGTLMACAYQVPDVRIGLIVGTGCNMCYMERVENIGLIEPQYKVDTHMILNVESGAFGEKGALNFIRTQFDIYIDEHSINKGTQIFEKLLSGMYLGELVRLILLRATRENLMFNSCNVRARIMHVFEHENMFKAKYISQIEYEAPSEMEKTRALMKELLNTSHISDEDCLKVKYVCEWVSKRSGWLIGTALAAILNKLGEAKSIVAIDGSVYRYHPKYDSYIREAIDKFLDRSLTYDLMLSEDGSGRGAALVAAVAALRPKCKLVRPRALNRTAVPHARPKTITKTLKCTKYDNLYFH